MTDRQQRLGSRVLWFAAGAVLNYLLLVTPFRWLRLHTDLSVWAISACSVAVGTVFFFVWNYFVNFRTEARDSRLLARYAGAVILLWMLSSVVLTLLKHFDARLTFSLGSTPLDFDIIATQCFLAGLKFWLYHKWVFPTGVASLTAASATPSRSE